MGLEYHLKPTEQEDLKLELAPRNQCRSYIAVNGRKAILISKKEFDTYYRNKEFADGPHQDSLGDEYGEPYNPDRQAFGRLKSGKIVYCELSETLQEKTERLLKLLKEIS